MGAIVNWKFFVNTFEIFVTPRKDFINSLSNFCHSPERFRHSPERFRQYPLKFLSLPGKISSEFLRNFLSLPGKISEIFVTPRKDFRKMCHFPEIFLKNGVSAPSAPIFPVLLSQFRFFPGRDAATLRSPGAQWACSLKPHSLRARRHRNAPFLRVAQGLERKCRVLGRNFSSRVQCCHGFFPPRASAPPCRARLVLVFKK